MTFLVTGQHRPEALVNPNGQNYPSEGAMREYL